MSAFKSYSQAAQDRFVVAVTGGKHGGTFLDVGCCHPTELSNTYALESHFAWRGLLVDNDPGAVDLCAKSRIGPSLFADATTLNWESAIKEAFKIHNANFGDIALAQGWRMTNPIDYLSLDVDAATVAALENLLRHDISFRVATVEHDAYRFGDEPRSAIRRLLFQRGYDLICADVCSAEGLPFEDWWVSQDLADSAARFRSNGKRWTEIFPT
jgi:hypothetical protein